MSGRNLFPDFSTKRESPYTCISIYEKCPKAKYVFERNSENTIFYLLGRDIPTFDEEEMVTLWYISGNMITNMYKKAISDRMGVG